MNDLRRDIAEILAAWYLNFRFHAEQFHTTFREANRQSAGDDPKQLTSIAKIMIK